MNARQIIQQGPATPLPWHVNVGEMELDDQGHTSSWYCLTPYPDDAADPIVLGVQQPVNEPPSDSEERDFVYLAACANEASALVQKVARLKELVQHCWVHSGYQNCGFKQMDGDMQALYEAVCREELP